MAAKKSSKAAGIFSPGTIEFLVELTENNDRDWFKEHQPRYESLVREPAREFIRAMAPQLKKFSKNFMANDKKVGGSLMRVQRDTRFGADKTPYKTNIGIHFRHEAGKDVHAPGLYVHIDPAEVFVGVGMWHPDAPSLSAVRTRIAEQPKAWLKVRDDAKFRGHFALSGDSLKRPPKGFDAEHPCIEDLKRKDHLAVMHLSHTEAFKPDFPAQVASYFMASKPYVKFMCTALELPC